MTETIHDPVGVVHVPHPGSRMDAVSQATLHETPIVHVMDVGDDPQFIVPVRNESANLARYSSTLLSTSNPFMLLLPQDPRRRQAFILAVDNDVYLCSSRDIAQSITTTVSATQVNAFYLPKNIVFPVYNQSAIWVAVTTTATTSRISTAVEKDTE